MKYESVIEERAYGKGRRAKFVFGAKPVGKNDIVKDLEEVGGSFYNTAHYNAWMDGYSSKVQHNPLPKPKPFSDSPVISQKIIFNSKKKGLIIAFVKKGDIHIGYSLCNEPSGDRYDDEAAWFYARNNSKPLSTIDLTLLPEFRNVEFTNFFHQLVHKTVVRAINYFQQVTPRFDYVDELEKF